jgi:hypothetical protein
MSNDKFKMSPIHDKKVIISMMDELKPEDMAEVVELITSKQPKNQTALDIVISQLKEEIVKSAHKDSSTIRSGDYRIGLTKAINFCTLAKEMENEQKKHRAIESYYLYSQYLDQRPKIGGATVEMDFEQWYNETYGGNK